MSQLALKEWNIQHKITVMAQTMTIANNPTLTMRKMTMTPNIMIITMKFPYSLFSDWYES